MTARPRPPSPLLATASSMIADASAGLVTPSSRFRHSFEVALAAIAADPEQPRKNFPEAEITGLAASMAEQGLLQPVLLRRDPAAAGRWIIVAGERRWRAARLLGWATLLAIETDGDPDVVTILENLQRVDLSAVEEARGLQRLIARKHWSQDRAAAALGRTKSEISASLRILTLPEALLDAVLTSEPALPRNVLVELSRLQELARAALLARGGPLTVQAIRAAARNGGAPPPPAPRDTSLRARLDATTAAIEAAIRHGISLDAATCDALQRLRMSVGSLLQGAALQNPQMAAQAAHKAGQQRR
jgi:ParB family chromosome partitioning protein